MNTLIQTNNTFDTSSSLSSSINHRKNENQKKYLNMLIFASQYNHLDTIKCLVDLKVDLNQKDKTGSTPLMYASQKGYYSIVQYLINNGANINEINNSGLTALMYASLYGHISTVGYLLFKGAFIDQKDHEGSTALFYAISSKRLDIVQYLINHGANSSIINKNNVTAFKLASDKHYDDITYYLLHHTIINKRKESLLTNNKVNDLNNYNKINSTTITSTLKTTLSSEKEKIKNINDYNQNNTIQIKNHEKNYIMSNHKKFNLKSKKNTSNYDNSFNIFNKKLNSKKSLKSLKVINFDDSRHKRTNDISIHTHSRDIIKCYIDIDSLSNEWNDFDEKRYSFSSIIDEYRDASDEQSNNFSINNLYKNSKFSKILVFLNEEHNSLRGKSEDEHNMNNEMDFEEIKKRFQSSSSYSKNDKIHQFFSNVILNIKSYNKQNSKEN